MRLNAQLTAKMAFPLRDMKDTPRGWLDEWRAILDTGRVGGNLGW